MQNRPTPVFKAFRRGESARIAFLHWSPNNIKINADHHTHLHAIRITLVHTTAAKNKHGHFLKITSASGYKSTINYEVSTQRMQEGLVQVKNMAKTETS